MPKKRKAKRRSECPLNASVEMLGDRWSLLIIRDMMLRGSRTYKDFLDCVTNHKQPWMDADKAQASSKTAWLAELSNDQKREVKWDEIA